MKVAAAEARLITKTKREQSSDIQKQTLLNIHTMKSRILALVGAAIVIAGSLAFTTPTRKEVVKSTTASEKIAIDKQTAGGFAIDRKD